MSHPTFQEFDGLRYYLCGKYYQRNGVRLHRVVWTTTHGREIPSGYHVHHVDGDRANNHPDNLELKPSRQHLSDHNLGHQRGVPLSAIEAAKAWHASEAGRAWHQEHYEQTKAVLHRRAEFTCLQCGATFETVAKHTNRFCSGTCKTKYRKASGVDDVPRVCAGCGETFTVNRYARRAYCTKSCGQVTRRARESALSA